MSNSKHKLKITRFNKRTGEVYETTEETFFSIYNLDRKKTEVLEDWNYGAGEVIYKTEVEKLAA